MVIEEKLTNQSLRKQLFNVPSIWIQLKKRQFTFVGKLGRKSEDQIPTKLLIAWCDNKRKQGAPRQNNKKNLSHNIRHIVPEAAKDGIFTTWV